VPTVVFTLFFFILYSNLLGLFPWGASPTGNLAVTAALAILDGWQRKDPERAERAVHLAATHALGHYALAFVYFLRKETASFRAEAEKALALNPMDGSVMGILGVPRMGQPGSGHRHSDLAFEVASEHVPLPSDITSTKPVPVWVDRPRALFSARGWSLVDVKLRQFAGVCAEAVR
jgi:hypothetical protein